MLIFCKYIFMNKPSFTAFFVSVVVFSCKKKTLFEEIPSSHSGIHFNNKITESDSVNALDMVNPLMEAGRDRRQRKIENSKMKLNPCAGFAQKSINIGVLFR